MVAALRGIAELVPLVVPLHPRGRETLEAAGLGADPRVLVIEPLGYVDFMSLVRGAAIVITDSGGIQEETTVLGVPCLTLRPNTERPITISHGTNRLVEPEAALGRRTRSAERSASRSRRRRRRCGTVPPANGSRRSWSAGWRRATPVA